jgi:osmoprotectant transport system ATP-binding protein
MIRFSDITKTYDGNSARILDGIDLEVIEGEVHILLGPSGCGKTTLLRMVNRLIAPTSGEITVDDKNIKEWNPIELRRHIGYVIQEVGLFPHLTVGENIGIVPKLLKWPEAKIRERVLELVDLIGLTRDYLSKRPRELSGGQKQRAGVARALAADPPILLMDEPFGAIDPITRRKLQAEFSAIQSELGKTVLFVTHDIDEALLLGSRITILRSGHLVETGTAKEMLSEPTNDFVAELFGGDLVQRRMSVQTAGDACQREAISFDDSFSIARFDESLLSVVARMYSEGTGAVKVIDSDGAYLGYIDGSTARESVRALQQEKGIR